MARGLVIYQGRERQKGVKISHSAHHNSTLARIPISHAETGNLSYFTFAFITRLLFKFPNLEYTKTANKFKIYIGTKFDPFSIFNKIFIITSRNS